MEKHRLGTGPLETAPLIFGGNVFGWTLDEASSFALIDAWLDAGFNMIDTADVYSIWADGHRGGESERVLGRYFTARGNRDRVVLASKVGMSMGEERRRGLSRSWIMQAVEDSLRRLQTDYLDLYFSHEDDLSTPLEETLAAYERLIDQGKVRVIGASNYGSARLTHALAVAGDQHLPHYQVLQPLYNLCERTDFENDLAPVCTAHGLGVTPYFALAAGFLTGKYRDRDQARDRARETLVEKYFTPRGTRILDALDGVARRYGASPATIALAWLKDRPGVSAPIVSATSRAQLDQLIQAAGTRLDAEAQSILTNASAE